MKKVFLTISSCFFIFLFISNFSINSKSYQNDFTIETANKIYTYRIYIAEPAYISESGCDLISFETGEYLFYYGNGNITMYTCWDIDNPAPSYSGNYRFVVRAEYISKADK